MHMLRSTLLRILCALAMMLSAARSGFCAGGGEDPKLEAFIKAYAEAVNAKDLSRVKALIDPQVLAQITPKTRAFHDQLLTGHFAVSLPAHFTRTLVQIPADAELPFPNLWSF